MQISPGLPRPALCTLEGPEVAMLGEYCLRVLSSSVASQRLNLRKLVSDYEL